MKGIFAFQNGLDLTIKTSQITKVTASNSLKQLTLTVNGLIFGGAYYNIGIIRYTANQNVKPNLAKMKVILSCELVFVTCMWLGGGGGVTMLNIVEIRLIYTKENMNGLGGKGIFLKGQYHRFLALLYPQKISHT